MNNPHKPNFICMLIISNPHFDIEEEDKYNQSFDEETDKEEEKEKEDTKDDNEDKKDSDKDEGKGCCDKSSRTHLHSSSSHSWVPPWWTNK